MVTRYLHIQDKLEVEELSRGLKVRSDKPHLVSLGGGRLSTAVTLLPLDEGKSVCLMLSVDVCLLFSVQCSVRHFRPSRPDLFCTYMT